MLHAPPENRENGNSEQQERPAGSIFKRIKMFFRGKPDSTLRETIEEYIDEYIEEPESLDGDTVSAQERALLSNILELRDITVTDVMIPRTDIAAISEDISQSDLLNILAEKQYSRLPVFRDNLDNVLGTIHIKDILKSIASGQSINVETLITEIPIVSPAMPVLNLILEMQKSRRHMAMVVDEFGGIDGLVTIGDIIEAIIGEIDDEHDSDTPPQITKNADGSIIADARLSLTDFERHFDIEFDDTEHEESDTIGGLVCLIAGRVPARGEVIHHAPSGIVFEVRSADPRRVRLMRIRNAADNDQAPQA